MNLSITPEKRHCTALWNVGLFLLIEILLFSLKTYGFENSRGYVVEQ